MGVVPSLEQFGKLLAASRLMSAEELRGFVDSLPAETRPKDARTLAQSLVMSKKLTKFQATAVYQGQVKGLVLGEYVVLDKIGQGGMGVVLKAHHRRMERLAAVKVLAKKAVGSPEAIKRFHREAKAAARLSHPNVVAVYDATEHDGAHYLVMEFVDGEDLAALVKRRGPLPESEVLDTMLQAAEGLRYAHDQGVVHRDIKPANLLLARDGTLKILDMGLARLHTTSDNPKTVSDDRLTQSGQVMGTCDYMAPEQAEDTHRADHRADIYSLGCTLYRLLTGKSMYTGETLMQILLAHRQLPIPWLREAYPSVSEQVEEVYRKMVAKRPEDRYQSMAEVVSALAACRRSVPVASDGQAETQTFQGREKSDSKLTAFLKGFSPAQQTIQQQTDVDTGEAGALPTAEKGNSRPWWRYALIGGGAALAILLAVVVMNSGDKGDGPSQVAQADKEPSEATDARPVLGSSESEPETIPEEPDEMPPPGSAISEEPPQPEPEPVAEVDPPETVVEVEPVAPPEPPPAAIDPAMEARRQLLEAHRAADAKWTVAMGPVEASVATWDFTSARQAAEGVQFSEPNLAQRLEYRSEEIGRMGSLKQRIISQIQQADPPLKKSDLRVSGVGGTITNAGPAGIMTETIQGDVERLTWNDLGAQATGKLLELVVDSTDDNDCLAAALLAFASGDRPAAERYLAQATAAGADTSAHLSSMAAATLSEAAELLDRGEFAKSQSLLENMESKYAELPWLAVNRVIFDATLATADAGVHQAEAEALFAEAVEFHQAEALFDLRDAVERLTNDYGNCPAVTEANRDPSLADFQQAVADVGKFLAVRLDGQGDFQSIQAAIDAAVPNSLIEIQDNGPYNEKLEIANTLPGLTLRGKEGTWPIITSEGATTPFAVLLNVNATNCTLERLLLLHTRAAGQSPKCVGLTAPESMTRVRRCVLYAAKVGGITALSGNLVSAEVDGSVLVNSFACARRVTVSNSALLCLGPNGCGGNSEFNNVLVCGYIVPVGECQIQSCTIGALTVLNGETSRPTTPVFRDCILPSIQSGRPGVRLEFCNVYGETPFIGQVKPGEGYIWDTPMFVKPEMLDYSLMPNSPCRGRASDGGDLGVRYTPEMVEMFNLALELRRQGRIEF